MIKKLTVLVVTALADGEVSEAATLGDVALEVGEPTLAVLVTPVLLVTVTGLLVFPVAEMLPFALREDRLEECGGLFDDSRLGTGGDPLREPGESGLLSKEERDELLPVLMLMLMDDLVPMRTRGGLSPTSDWFSLAVGKTIYSYKTACISQYMLKENIMKENINLCDKTTHIQCVYRVQEI